MIQRQFFLLKLLIIFMILFAMGCASSGDNNTNIVFSPEFSANSKLRVAVLEFDAPKGGTEKGLFGGVLGGSQALTNTGKNIADQLAERMMTIPGIRVIDRSRINSILKEKNISMDKVLESGTLNEIAKIAGIDAIVTGSVGEATGNNTLLVFQSSSISFTARCVRAADGVVLWSGSILSEVGSDKVTRAFNNAVEKFVVDLEKQILKRR